MLLIDAAWQAASSAFPAGQLRLVECSMKCPAFTELFGEVWIFLESVTANQIGFRIEQEGRTTAKGELRLAPIAAASAAS